VPIASVATKRRRNMELYVYLKNVSVLFENISHMILVRAFAMDTQITIIIVIVVTISRILTKIGSLPLSKPCI
jgi:hypothetical protein